MIKAEFDAQRLVESLANQACLSLFEAYGVNLTEVQDDLDQPHEKAALSAIIGFSGPGIRGACILAATAGPLERSNPAAGSLRDWIAELSNQLVGRIKNKLLGHGVAVYVTTPVVLRGDHLAPLPRHVLLPQLFSIDGGTVFLWVEVESEPDFRLSPTPEPAAVEGEALFF